MRLLFQLSRWFCYATGASLQFWLGCAFVLADEPIHEPHLKVLNSDRIASLESDQRSTWEAYLRRSSDNASLERKLLAKEIIASNRSTSTPAPTAKGSAKAEAWQATLGSYQTDEARRFTETILSFQTPTGGWSKAVNYLQGERKSAMHWTSQSGAGWHYCGTIDNGSTTEQIRFLAANFAVTQHAPCRDSAIRGIEWLLMAQFPTGGWPQVYPLEPGYHEAITLNDNAMLHVLEVLIQVGHRDVPFGFVSDELAARCRIAHQKGIECLVKSQVRFDGQATVWCAQHDPIDLLPTAARKMEPASLSGAESADVLKHLMRYGPDNEEVREAIESGVKWLAAHEVKGLRKTQSTDGQTRFVPDEASPEIYWARFYDLKTQQPVFFGAQDGVEYHTFAAMAERNKVAYDYFTTRPRDVITKEYARWKKARGTR